MGWTYSNSEEIRIDKFLLSHLGDDYSRTKIQNLLDNNFVFVNDKIVKKSKIVKIDDLVVLKEGYEAFIEKPYLLEPENIPLNIVYEDNDIIVINKPKGLVVHPGSGNRNRTLCNGLIYHFQKLSDINGDLRPGILHRLDKDTSGLLIIAKNNKTHNLLAEQLKQRDIKRIYYAIVWGHIDPSSGTIEKNIGRHPSIKVKMSVTSNGKNAITYYTTIQSFSMASLIRFELNTGRTHQIRVHSSSINHSIIGDHLYEKNINIQTINTADQTKVNQIKAIASSQLLYAREISFIHPHTKENIHLEVPTPDDFQQVIDILTDEKN